jgi:hypothetical protein
MVQGHAWGAGRFLWPEVDYEFRKRDSVDMKSEFLEADYKRPRMPCRTEVFPVHQMSRYSSHFLVFFQFKGTVSRRHVCQFWAKA